MGKRKFSDQHRFSAIDLYKSGKTIKQCSLETRISESYIKNLLSDNKILTRPSGFQKGNKLGLGKHTTESKNKIRLKHLQSGHKPRVSYKKRFNYANPHVDLVGYIIYCYKVNCEKRNIDFSLERIDVESLIKGKCFYCGCLAKNKNKDGLIYNGIDRVDSKMGYLKENCVTCCKVCNFMKSKHSKEFFINHCKMVSKNHGVE